jgi:hypothetical protein
MSIILVIENKSLGFALGIDLSYTDTSIPRGLTMLSTMPLTNFDERKIIGNVGAN